jgi:hypothetical protein
VAINATTGEARTISNIPSTYRPPLDAIQTSRGMMFARVISVSDDSGQLVPAIEFRFEDTSIPTVTYRLAVTATRAGLVFGPDGVARASA